jgi:gamma-glutamylcyclotransferase (GGCT)/AIG2-like uncharacterized protein YtfP
MGTLAGRLWGLRRTAARSYGYPALVTDDAGRVVVELYRLGDREQLARLDALESYDPADEARSEYLRRRVEVIDGPVASAWAYRFVGELPQAADPIPGGNWVERRRRTS